MPEYTERHRLAALAVTAARLRVWTQACDVFRSRGLDVDSECHWLLLYLRDDFERSQNGYAAMFGRHIREDPDWERMRLAVAALDVCGMEDAR